LVFHNSFFAVCFCFNELFIYEFYLSSPNFFRGDNDENESNFVSSMFRFLGETTMKMKAILLAVCFAAVLAIGVNSAVADDMVPGAYSQQDQSVMGVGQTMVQMGAQQRALTDATNRASRAHMSRNSASGINVDQQFGSSQSNQSWKAAKTIEEANMQTGIIAGDCRGENSDDKYRKQMNQNRKGYMKERLVSNAQCAENHPTLK
jgi:hypothetical protein